MIFGAARCFLERKTLTPKRRRRERAQRRRFLGEGLRGQAQAQAVGVSASSPSRSRVTAKTPRREISIARIGALFDHAFQLPLWLLCACCALFGDVKMLRCALATTALAMTVGGYWGLEAFYAETCAKHGACPTDEIKMVQSQLCPGVVGVMCLSLFATLFDKEKPKQA